MRIRLAFYACASLSDDLSAELSSLRFGESEHERLCAIKNGAAKRESLAALLALDSLCDGGDLTILRDGHGKPRFSADGAPHFSLSHAGGLAVAALSDDAPVGVDLEMARDNIATSAVADRFFSEAEQLAFATHGDFFALWTKKEARAKCLGVPLSSVLSTPLSFPTRTYRSGDFTLSLAAERDFSVVFSPNDFHFQEVIL